MLPQVALAQSRIAVDLYKEGVRLGNEGKVEDALLKFQKAVMLEPKVFLFQLKLAYAYEMLKRYPEAEASYENAIALDSSSKEAWRGLGDVLRRAGFLSRAEDAYKKAIKISPRYKDAWLGLAYLYGDMEALDKAELAYLKVLGITPKDADVAFKLANVYWRSKRLDDAITYYKKALSLKPDFHDARFGLGVTLKEKGDTEGARKELKAACEAGLKQACKRLFEL
jgi:tetratricopeptide (TPR) repeat protein